VTLDRAPPGALHRPVSDKPLPTDPRARREAELAEALRANLKRRKASTPQPQPARDDEQPDRADPPLPPSGRRV
jgi:hypothetical protein